MKNSKPLFDINTFRECYEINREKGFHQEPSTSSIRQRLLMMVIGEAAEVLEAVRTGKYANRKAFEMQENDKMFFINYEDNIKGSFEEELADVLLRLFDYAGTLHFHYKGIFLEYEKEVKSWEGTKINDVGAFLFIVTKSVLDIYYGAISGHQLGKSVGRIHALAIDKGVDIHWFIEQKMRYNKERPFKNGKLF